MASMPLSRSPITQKALCKPLTKLLPTRRRREGHFASFHFNRSTNGAVQGCLQASKRQEICRPLPDYPPSIWGDHFALFTFNSSDFESYDRQVEELKPAVKDMLMDYTSDPVEKMKLFDSLCRLGVSYHFENEIEEQLSRFFDVQSNIFNDYDYDLYTVALVFQVFRQHGYKMSSDVFAKFMDNDGMFKENLTKDVKGMLSLYEASHWRIEGEDILENALAFTMVHLESLANQCSPHLAKRILNALRRAFHKGMPRIEARQYISFYEDNEFRNEKLLEFAKLDFNRLQSLHQEELSYLSSWWRDLNIVSKLPYARDRIVEIYFWMNGMYFEPQYSRSRIIATKLTKILSLVDDTYDEYGTLEELQCFTNAIYRWDIGVLDQQPDYLKVLYQALFNLFNELEIESKREERPYSFYYATEELKEFMRAQNIEAQWVKKGCVPSIDEYLEVAFHTCGFPIIIACAFIGMPKIAGIEAFQWLQSRPKILKATGTTARLRDDLTTHEAEERRGQFVSSIRCCMKQYNISKKEAIEKIEKMIEKDWNVVNEEYMRPSIVSKTLVQSVLNLARVADVSYKTEDGYTNPQFTKDYINSLFINEIPM